MAELKMKVNLDMSDVVRIVQLNCMALDCVHNTVNRGPRSSQAHCDFKHVGIGDDGKCKTYTPKKGIHGTDAEVPRA